MTNKTDTDVAAIKAGACEVAAIKADGGKPRMDLIAPEALMALGCVLDFGAKKYAARNWEKGMSWGRVHAAVMRHLMAWQGGQDMDEESGMPHLWHALTGIHFLVAYEVRGSGDDDRSPYAIYKLEQDDPPEDFDEQKFIEDVVGRDPCAPPQNVAKVRPHAEDLEWIEEGEDDWDQYERRRIRYGAMSQ